MQDPWIISLVIFPKFILQPKIIKKGKGGGLQTINGMKLKLTTFDIDSDRLFWGSESKGRIFQRIMLCPGMVI